MSVSHTKDEINESVLKSNKRPSEQALLSEYVKRFDYEFKSIERRWKMLTIFIAVSGFSLASLTIIEFKIFLSVFNVLTGLLSMAYWVQVRSRAYLNDLRLKEVADTLGIVGLAHIQKAEPIFRFKSVSLYVMLFMIIVTLGWVVILLEQIFDLPIP